MRQAAFLGVLAAILAAAAVLFFRQQLALTRLENSTADSLGQPVELGAALQAMERDAPPAELLRLRGEVASLASQLSGPRMSAASKRKAQSEWDRIWKGSKPSDHPGYEILTNAAPAGFATPAAAVQSFLWAFWHQSERPLTPSRMKEIWDVPDDFDEPGNSYNINMGLGYGGEAGYWIGNQERIADGVMSLSVDFEKNDGSWYNRKMILADHDGHWRVKPEKVWR